MKKICFFMENPFSLGGEQRVAVVLANYLVNNNYDVTFLLNCKESEKENSLYEIDSKISFIFLKKKINLAYKFKAFLIKILKFINYRTNCFKNLLFIQKWFYSLNKKEIANQICGNEFDYVIGVGSYFFSILVNIKNMLRSIKIIAWQHSTFENYYKMPNCRLYNQEKFIKEIFSKVDLFVCQTDSDKNKIEKEYGFVPIVINNPNTFMSKKNKRKFIKKNFIASGRMVTLKGFDKLVEAFYLFSQHNKEWNLYILGDGPEYKNIEKIIKDYDLQNRIIMTGKVDNIEKYYEDSSICIITSMWEGWSMVAVEAMQFGLGIISFELPSLIEIFGNEECGLFVKQGDVLSLANTMEKVVKDFDEINKFSVNSRKRVKKFDVDFIGKKWEDILK